MERAWGCPPARKRKPAVEGLLFDAFKIEFTWGNGGSTASRRPVWTANNSGLCVGPTPLLASECLAQGLLIATTLIARLPFSSATRPPSSEPKPTRFGQKLLRQRTPEGHFYFAAFYRSDVVIGFAMFGYYPGSHLVVVDHLVIDEGHRGDAAFYVFAQLLRDAIQNLGIEIDFVAVELEKGTEFGGRQTGGSELVKLLGQVGFGEFTRTTFWPNMEPKNFEARYDGI